VILTVSCSAIWLAELLPPALTLGAPRGGRPGRHPLVFIVGELTNGGAHFAGRELPFGTRYRELGVMIPFVKHARVAADVVLVHQMFADDALPVTLGNAVYGYRKRVARIDWQGSGYDVYLGDRLVVSCKGQVSTCWTREKAADNASLGWLADVFGSPILGLSSAGPYICSRFHWDLTAAETSQVDAHLRWFPEPAGDPLSFRASRKHSLAVRGMVWRTSSPETVTNV
jgi:hypothetical protein